MTGLEIQFLLGLYFTVTGLAGISGKGERGTIVTLIAGLLLLLFVFLRKSFIL